MCTSTKSRRLPAALAALALVAAALALTVATSAASAAGHGKDPRSVGERLVVRGEDTVKDPAGCPGGVCDLQIADGAFRGTLGTGAYGGTVHLRVGEAFPNGEGGLCAPIDSEIVLGAGSPDRLVLAIWGESCQDGKGDLTQASFTGVARFKVKYGTGAYAKARGHGLGSFVEDAADHEHMTLIGRITR
jgi:hypothetical protein